MEWLFLKHRKQIPVISLFADLPPIPVLAGKKDERSLHVYYGKLLRIMVWAAALLIFLSPTTSKIITVNV